MKTATINNTNIVIELIESPMTHHKLGLQYTATGYGKKIPTIYKALYAGRKHRVYSACFSNTTTKYILVEKIKVIISINY